MADSNIHGLAELLAAGINPAADEVLIWDADAAVSKRAIINALPFIQLQATSPGTAQTGNINISGKIIIDGSGSSTAIISILPIQTTVDSHGFEDKSVLNTVDTGHGYSCFDAEATFNNASAQSHFVAFQSYNVYDGSANLTGYMDGLHLELGHTGIGTIAKHRGVYVYDISGDGLVTESYGIYIENIHRGTSKNYSFYSAGGLFCNTGYGGIGTNPSGNNGLEVRGNLTLYPGEYIGFTGATAVGSSNYAIYGDSGYTIVNAPVIMRFQIAGNTKVTIDGSNLGLGAAAWGTSAANVFGIGSGTAPTTFPADMAQMCVKDQAAGNACFHFYTELGQIIKLYQQALVADAKTDYGAGDLDIEAEIISAINTANGKINSIFTILKNNGLMAAA